MKKKIQIIILLLTLTFSFLFMLDSRNDNTYPEHFDEYQDIAIAKNIMRTGKLSFLDSNTGFPRVDHDRFNRNFEMGFHVFLAEIGLTGFDLVLDYKYIPAFITVIILLTILGFIYSLTKNYWSAIPAMILYPTIQSNVTTLGPELFVPMTLAFAFIFLFFTSFIKWYEKESKVHFYLSLVYAATIVLIHPISLTFAIPIVILYLLMKAKLYERNKKGIKIYISIGILSIISALFLLRKENILLTINFILNNLVFKSGWMIPDIRFSILELTTLPVLILGIIGLFYSLKKKQFLIASWGVITIISFYGYAIFDATLFAPYHRAVHYMMLSILILVSLGIYYSGEWLIQNSSKKMFSKIVILFIIGIIMFNAYQLSPDPNLKFREIINDDNYEAIKWVDEEYGTENTVMLFSPEIWGFKAISENNLFLPAYEFSFAAGTQKLKDCYTKKDGLDIIISPGVNSLCEYEEVNKFGKYSVYIVQ